MRLPKQYRFEDQEEVLIHKEGQRVILEPKSKAWSESFLTLTGAAKDFPYPEEPPAVEPGPSFE